MVTGSAWVICRCANRWQASFQDSWSSGVIRPVGRRTRQSIQTDAKASTRLVTASGLSAGFGNSLIFLLNFLKRGCKGLELDAPVAEISWIASLT